MATKDARIAEALKILTDLGLPRQQQNDRTALCLLALLDISPEKSWKNSGAPLLGITPVMDWVLAKYSRKYAPNTRETFRRQSMHQLVDAGVATYNPDDPLRPVNSPKAVYQINEAVLPVLKAYGTKQYGSLVKYWFKNRPKLVEQYAKVREMQKVAVQTPSGALKLSPGTHSELIGKIIEDFLPRYAPGGTLVYVGDTGNKSSYFDDKLLASLGVALDNHGKFPDVIVHFSARNWLLLIESVTSHGPVDGKRHGELAKLFKDCKAGLVYVSAFPNRRTMNKYLDVLAWETEVWVADAPSHLIHFNGDRFLGPY